MIYEDTHVTPAQLPGIDANCFHMAVVKDETAAPMRSLFSNLPRGMPWPPYDINCRRLVIHVADLKTPGLDEVLRRVLGVDFDGARV